LPSEPRAGEAGHGRRLGWPAQFANSGKDSMQRHPVGLVAGPSAGKPTTEVAAGGRRNSRISVSALRNVVRWGWRLDGKRGRPSRGLAAGSRRDSQILNKTLCNVARWGWRRDRKRGRQAVDLTPGGRHNPQVADKTPCNVTR
jgi:hypothetical protein